MFQMNAGGVRPRIAVAAGEDDVLGGIAYPCAAPPSRRPIARVLVLTACPVVHETLRLGFEAMQKEVLHAEHPGGLADMIGPAQVDLLICDRRLLDTEGMELLRVLRHRQPRLPVVLLDDVQRGGHPEEAPLHDSALLTLPLTNDDLGRLLRATEGRQLPGPSGVDAITAFHGMLATTAAMQELFRKVCRVGPTDATVLVTGESGTGKELIARALHEESARREHPFIALNCAALPSELIESELFGHIRGAFTGAMRDRAGLFEAAHGGTLFLDEIGDLGLTAQAKVLRALENREITRLGGSRTTTVDVRVLAATNRCLEQLVEQGEFREDLLYRLDVIPLTLPPLRDRKADIPVLADHFIRLFAERHQVPPRALSAGSRELLHHYAWPGNVRELRNCVEGAVILTDSREIQPADFPVRLRQVSSSHARNTGRSRMEAILRESDRTFVEARELALAEFDREYLAAALRRHGGNIAQTARAIGLHRQSLQKLLTRRHLRVPSAAHDDEQ